MEITTIIDAQMPAIVALLEENGLVVANLARHRDTFYVISEDGRVTACAGLELYGESALLRSVAVARDRRSSGLGRTLTRHLIEECRSRGVRSVFLLTETAGGFFSRMGFAPVPRDRVPENMASNSVEFRGACPDTAVVMYMEL